MGSANARVQSFDILGNALSPTSGRLQERYEIMQQLGSGSTGVIYLAKSREASTDTPGDSPRNGTGALDCAACPDQWSGLRHPVGTDEEDSKVGTRGTCASGICSPVRIDWATAFGTLPGCIPGSWALLSIRSVFAAVFVAHWVWRLAAGWKHGFWLIYATNWAVTQETLYFCLLVCTTYAAQPQMPRNSADMPLQSCYGRSGRLPLLVEVTLVFHIIQLPSSCLTALMYWGLLNPTWSSDDFSRPDWLTAFENGGSFVLCFVSFLCSRIPYDLRNAGWFLVAVGAYLIWTLAHHWLRLGTPEPCRSATSGLPLNSQSDCPIYPVLDWRRPQETGLLALAVCLVLSPLLAFSFWLVGLLRDQADSLVSSERCEAMVMQMSCCGGGSSAQPLGGKAFEGEAACCLSGFWGMLGPTKAPPPAQGCAFLLMGSCIWTLSACILLTFDTSWIAAVLLAGWAVLWLGLGCCCGRMATAEDEDVRIEVEL